jgi:hypothetical protein
MMIQRAQGNFKPSKQSQLSRVQQCAVTAVGPTVLVVAPLTVDDESILLISSHKFEVGRVQEEELMTTPECTHRCKAEHKRSSLRTSGAKQPQAYSRTPHRVDGLSKSL